MSTGIYNELINRHRNLRLRKRPSILSFFGRWFGTHCTSCGEPYTEDIEKYKQGYSLDKWCTNKDCSKYEFKNRLIKGVRC